MGVSADGLGEWRSEGVGTVYEFRVVAAPSNAVVIGSSLVRVGTAPGNNGRFAGEGEGGKI